MGKYGTLLSVVLLLGCQFEPSTEAPSKAAEYEHLVGAVDGAAFDVLLSTQGEKPVLVDFWAEWCGPCKLLAPSVAEIAGEYEDRLTVAKVNIDEAPELAQRFNIDAIPTLIVFRGGQEITRVVGPDGKAEIVAMLRPLIQ